MAGSGVAVPAGVGKGAIGQESLSCISDVVDSNLFSSTSLWDRR